MSNKNPWRKLWQEWFSEDGDPWCYDDSWGVHNCSFCGHESPGHTQYCVYVRAKELLEQVNEEVTSE